MGRGVAVVYVYRTLRYLYALCFGARTGNHQVISIKFQVGVPKYPERPQEFVKLVERPPTQVTGYDLIVEPLPPLLCREGCVDGRFWKNLVYLFNHQLGTATVQPVMHDSYPERPCRHS